MSELSSVVVVGGCGHVGLPLAISLASVGHSVVALDISEDAVRRVNSGQVPFVEPGAQDALVEVLREERFFATSSPDCISRARHLVVVIGTPVDEHLNPEPSAVLGALEECIPWMKNGQTVILRSTIFPGVTEGVERLFRSRNLEVSVAFCPERIAEGFAMEELRSLPQIIGARNETAFSNAETLFQSLGVATVRVSPEEAELAKLFTNAWRYIKFAAANQFWRMANDAGLDFSRIRNAITFDYPRAADMPGAGLAAGPCLLKDTMQLAAFSNNSFLLGHSAMLVNEGLPLYLADRLSDYCDLKVTKVGILGMAFKGGSDDTRSSLAYKLRRILEFRASEVLCTDPLVKSDPRLVSLETVLEECSVFVIAAPHREYAELTFPGPVIDIWDLRGSGSRA